MALTDAQKLSAFECLGVIYGPGGGDSVDASQIHSGFGLALTLESMDTLRDAVSEYLDNLSAAVETKVAAIIVEWDSAADKVGKIESGGTGGIQGASFSWEEKRTNIRQRLMHYVPVMHMAEALERRAGPKGPSYVTVAR